MDATSDGDPKLDDVLLFNDYLLKLSHAGVPIGLDGSGTTSNLLDELTKINSRFAMGVARGSSIREILESNEGLSIQYRSALSTWLYCDRSPDALTALSECAASRNDMQKLVGYAMLQPLILLLLVYFGMISMLVFLAPKMQAVSNQIRATPGLGLRFLSFAMQTMWLWTLAVPLLVVLGIMIWRQNRSRWSYFWFPGRRSIAEAIQQANYADGIANLMEHDHSKSRARELMSLEPSSQTHMTPLMQWAFGSEVRDEERANALYASAQAFRNLAQSRSNRFTAWLPIFFGAIFGGGLVLFYGLSLFAPMIELLLSLSQPKS